MTSTTDTTSLDTWAIVEIMGHRSFAGRVTEQAVGGASFIRIDVPAVSDVPGFTKLFGASSIYCISPCTEEVARAAAELSRSRPVDMYQLPRPQAPMTVPEYPDHDEHAVDDDDDFLP